MISERPVTVGGHKTGYVTWQSALGHKATGAASLTVGGQRLGLVDAQTSTHRLLPTAVGRRSR